jgi:hypothetical protein
MQLEDLVKNLPKLDGSTIISPIEKKILEAKLNVQLIEIGELVKVNKER